MDKKTVCLLSGGLDSAVAAAILDKKGYQLFPLFFDYGQVIVGKEKECFLKLVDYFDVPEYKVIELEWLRDMGGTALTNGRVGLNAENRELEYVPFRNSIFLSIATAWAEVKKADFVMIGSTGGDEVCPDNSPEYLDAFQKAIDQGTMLHQGINILAPLSGMNKTEAVKKGFDLGVDFSITWSCHNQEDEACGVCSNCEARLEAFANNDIEDDVIYV